ncbi:MAG: fumarylacetoacetate hydrolase family protein [Pseudomonadota bacterium]
MTDLLFPAAPVPTLGLVGESARMPINRIFCIGRNYVAHAAEMGNTIDRDDPFFFTKSHGAVALSGSDIAYPPGTQDYHHEVELAVALGSGGRDIAVADADAYVLGYALSLDMTRRDLQAKAKSKGRPWSAAKDVEHSAVLTDLARAEAFQPGDQEITLTVNGAVTQAGKLSEMVWSVSELIAFLSTLYTLQPGDLILTGTPSGVGPVQIGDQLVGTVPGLPTLTCTITPPVTG